jgi:exosortase E/protease (VPEID-CTERM system)
MLPLVFYTAVVALVLVLEKFFIGSHVYGAVKASGESVLGAFLFSSGKGMSRTLVLSGVIFLILIQSDLKRYFKLFSDSFNARSLSISLVLQIVVFGLFYALTDTAFAVGRGFDLIQFLWVLLGLALVPLTLSAVGHYRFWQALIVEQKWLLILALVVGNIIWFVSNVTQDWWIHFSDVTFALVAKCLSLFFNDVYLDYGERIVGLNDFLVTVDSQCSGYEGIGLVIGFVSVFLYSFRRDFKFPKAFLLYPIGALVIWTFNILRIVVLIMIGSFWSPDVAIWGFHAQAGWITFIITSVGLLWLAHNSPFFAKQVAKDKPPLAQSINLPIATLLPLVVLLAMTFITKALSGHFDWLYPLRVIAVAAMIFNVYKQLPWRPYKMTWFPLLAGALVAVIWGIGVGIDPEVDALYGDIISNSNTLLLVGWMVFRFVGAVITIPIAEELGFRAYLLCRASSQQVSIRGALPFSLVGVAVSSIAFGLLHGAWFYASVAGLVYAYVRYKGEHIMDAVIAHGVTNLLLMVYVLYSGHWSML